MKIVTMHRCLFLTVIVSIHLFCLPLNADTFKTDSVEVSHNSYSGIPEIKSDFRPEKLILPASLITIGSLGTAINGMNNYHLFRNKKHTRQIRIDDYLEWGMLGWVFVCDLAGKEKHHFTDQIFLLLLAEGMNAGMVRGLKKGINETRPDGGPHSFPSGHTSNVFLGAHLAFKEFKDTNLWLAYSGYAIGTFVGFSRLYNNRHWLADVIAGAGFGVLSVELAYLIYFPLRNGIVRKINKQRENRWMIAPNLSYKQKGVSLVYRF